MAACLYLYEAVRTVSLCCILIASLVFSAYLFGHTLRFGSIRISSISDLTYRYYSHISISSSCVRVSLHIPRRSNPRWATLTAYDYEFKDSECHVSFTKVHVTFWFFPFLLRFTAGPLASVELDDFRLRVFSSKATPGWVELLRRNLITTVLTGEMIRLDDFKTKVTFSTITGATDGFSGPVEKPGVPHGEEQDEIRVSASWEQWHILNWQGRMYTFGKLDAQLRKSWVEERGSFVMIAEECRWTKVSSFVNRETFRNSYGWWQLMQSIVYLPSDVFKYIRDPASSIDLYVTCTSLTFDNFRLQDAELLKHGGAVLKKEWDDRRREGAFQSFGWDTFVQAVLTFCK